MARYLSKQLIEKLKTGEYSRVLRCINRDRELSLEIRNSEAKVYYRKGLVLTINGRGHRLAADGYFKTSQCPELDREKPEKYFKSVKEAIDDFGRRGEFTVQQLIALYNSDKNSDYLVVDMEYQFAQMNISNNDRIDKSRIDIVAVERDTKSIILFELKKDSKAIFGDSGNEDHIRKMGEHIKNEKFCKQLREDVRTIIKQKIDLGIYEEGMKKYIPDEKDKVIIKPMFIFSYETDDDRNKYDDEMERLKNKGMTVPETIYIPAPWRLKKEEK